jgi:hypothetical protein
LKEGYLYVILLGCCFQMFERVPTVDLVRLSAASFLHTAASAGPGGRR